MQTWCRLLASQSDDRLREKIDRLGLASALEILCRDDFDAGIVRENVGHLQYFQLTSGTAFFQVQYNPRRAARPGVTIPVETCRLCLETIVERGGQRYVSLDLNGRRYAALANPYPYMPIHTTIASGRHEPQLPDAAADRSADGRWRRIMEDLFALTSALADFVVIYNGPDAGATIPVHFHFQAFRPPTGLDVLPIQAAAASIRRRDRSRVVRVSPDTGYPLVAFRVDCREHTPRVASDIMREWDTIQGAAASVNLIGVSEGGRPCLYVVPRNRLFRRAAGFSGLPGALECAGVFVATTDSEYERLQTGQLSAESLASVLAGVRPTAAARLQWRKERERRAT